MDSRMIKTGLALALVLFGSWAGARAQETISPEKRALIKELLDLTGGTKNIKLMLESTLQQQEKDLPVILAQSRPQQKDRTLQEQEGEERRITEASLRIGRRMREVYERINYAKAIEDLSASIFAKHFNESELKDWIAFYQSPRGKKTIELMPVIFAETIASTSEILLPQLQKLMTEVIAEEMKLGEQTIEPLAPPPQPRRTKRRARH